MHWSNLSRDDSLKRFAVVGGNLSESLLPSILCSGCAQVGADSIAIDVSAEEFEACVLHLRDIGFRGLAIAPPHKVHAARLATKFFTVRYAMGVANTIAFFGDEIYAQNTEVPAIRSLVKKSPVGTALLLGAGSGGRSVAVALLEEGWKLKVWARNAMRTRLLQTTVKGFGDLELVHAAEPLGCNLIVNATPLGAKAGEKPPLEWRPIRPGTTAMDLVYRRVPTEFLRDAKLRGCPTIDGREIVVEKTALSLEWLLETSIDRTPMLAAAGLKV